MARLHRVPWAAEQSTTGLNNRDALSCGLEARRQTAMPAGLVPSGGREEEPGPCPCSPPVVSGHRQGSSVLRSIALALIHPHAGYLPLPPMSPS